MAQPQIIDDADCESIGGLKIGRKTRSTQRTYAPVLFCSPHIPQDMKRNGTQTTAMEAND
jgi:hypothetical protein